MSLMVKKKKDSDIRTDVLLLEIKPESSPGCTIAAEITENQLILRCYLFVLEKTHFSLPVHAAHMMLN